MAKLTPDQIADKQIKKAMAAVNDWKAGVQAVTEAPTKLAALKIDKMVAGVLEAAQSGKTVDALNNVSLQTWQTRTLDKGGNNYAPGIQRAKDRIIDFQKQATPYRQNLSRQIKAMPNDTFEERLQRMEANARGMKQFKYRRSPGI